MQRAGKLAQHIVPLGIQAGDAVGDHGLGIHFGRCAVTPARHSLGNHHRQIRHAGYGGSIDVVEHEAELPLEALARQLLGRVREVQFHLVVDVALIFGMIVRIVGGAVFLDVRKEFASLLVVCLHLRARQAVVGQMQDKVHFVELPGVHLLALSVIAQQLGDHHIGGKIPVLEIVVAVHVSGDADGSPGEIHRGEGYSLAYVVGNPAAHLCCLRIADHGRKKQRRCRKQIFQARFHIAKLRNCGE